MSSGNGKKKLVVVRVRGRVAPREVNKTLELLNIKKKFRATLVDNCPSYLGMLNNVRNYIAWGEISKENLVTLLRKRGRLIGDKPLTDKYLERNTDFSSVEELAEKIYNCECSLKDVKGLKKFFRLRPPKKGFKGSIKKSVENKGILGYHGEKINELIARMI